MGEIDVRTRLYDAYSSTQAGAADPVAEALAFRRDVRPHLPPPKTSVVLDLGCGQGQLVKQLQDNGYLRAGGIDISPEQVALAHAAGIESVRLGDFRDSLTAASLDAVTATDFLEHLTKTEVLEAADHVWSALHPGGVFIVRVPNSVSPFAGNYRYGDLTHETSFTARSLRQLGAAAGYVSVEVFPCPPSPHGVKSAARATIWRAFSGAMKLALAAETGSVRGHLVTQNIVGVMRKGSADEAANPR